MNEPKKYRKKPVVVEAWQFTGIENIQSILNWINKDKYRAYENVDAFNRDKKIIEIYTLEGTHKAIIGDYIIKGIAGEFYPCKPDIFEKTYEAV